MNFSHSLEIADFLCWLQLQLEHSGFAENILLCQEIEINSQCWQNLRLWDFPTYFYIFSSPNASP